MVNDDNFGELLIQGLEQVRAHRRGEHPAARVVKRLRPPWRVDTVDEADWEEAGLDDDADLPPQAGVPRNRLRP